MFAQIINAFLNVRNHIQDKNGVWKPVKEPTIKMVNAGPTDVLAGQDIVLFDEQNKKVIVDVFEFTVNGSANSTHPILHLAGYSNTQSYDGQIFHSLNSTNGPTRFVATPQRIAGDGSSYFEILEYNSTANEFKFALKRPIELPQGGRLALRPLTSYVEGDKVQYKCIYRVWE